MEDMPIENSEVVDGRLGLSDDGYTLSSSSFKGGDNITNDSAFYEKFLLDDLDSYWDDLNVRLTVSRMVSDSVIKGMVGAVAGEAADSIASKEAEIATLSERLRSCEFDAAKADESLVKIPKPSVIKVDTRKIKSELQQSYFDSMAQLNYTEHFGRLKVAVEEQLQMLKKPLESVRTLLTPGGIDSCYADVRSCEIAPQAKTTETMLGIDERVDALNIVIAVVFEQFNDMFCSVKTLECEQWEHDIQREVVATVIQDSIRGLHDEFGTKLYEQRKLLDTLNTSWQKKVADLSAMREELDAVSRSLFSSDMGLLFPHNSHESFEERNTTKRKDHFPQSVLGNHHVPFTSHPEENGTISMEKSGDSGKLMLEFADSSQLKHMTKEELIAYYRSEMTNMRRQHDSALQEKTEELFRFKREFLKEKGSSPFRKDKELELLRKKIPEIILKLDDILLEKEKYPMAPDEIDELCSFKDRIDTLFFENQRLRGILTNKRKEVKCLSSQISDAASQMSLHSSVEANFLNQIKKLKGDVEDVKIEVNVREEVYKSILRELIGEHICDMEDMQIESEIVQEIYSTILKVSVGVAMSTIDPIISQYYTEKASLKAMLLEKENALCLEMEENEKLKHDIMSLSTLMKEKDKFASEAGSTLMQQKEHFDLVTQELGMLRDQLIKQEILSSEKTTELDSMKSRVNETLQQMHQYEMEISKLNQKFKIASDALEEKEKQKAILCDIIEEKQKTLSSSIIRDTQQAKKMKCIMFSVIELSRAVADSESRFTEIIERNESRLKVLNHECISLTQQASLLRKEGLWYRQILEVKSLNLQKAESEVDLLGDEVDALLSLLGKIYITLDHYSPVFELYPGVMDILKLVQRELKGETIRLV